MGSTDTAPDTWQFAEGDPITDDLTAVKLLGGGSSYEAYLAFDDITYAPVVVKVVRPSLVADDSSLRGLRREVEALATVNHPVVVRGLRHRLDGERPHVVLEQIDGPRLSSLVRRYGPLQEQQYVPLAIELASALHYLRHLGWTHLDIKPSNVIMGAPARLIDLSVARRLEDAAALRVPIGTDRYLSPEQCDPPTTGEPGHASDVWGLCATLFEAVAGYRAFDDGDLDADDVRVRYPQLVDAPYELPDRVPDEVVKILYAGLEKRPENRPLPHEVAEALEPVLARQPRARLAGFKVR
ncbi:serine/threonine-protein kinase [Nocardioides lianchengensis]|uniref:non-specific serine/threonine protein kinase n=1 Tax=Nocardioides lianchengensis TaxID=1045774 RepID=A0A1G7BWB3_9ACTN|nr:serine/threonine-protein kinase [Nocardioides lianchengensis]NYG09312.1 serine/threonine protein kinase [Nocardioides lianchengensis]SDE31299.1 serine/threonine protein kinase [Nocardioides lianchengensis]